MLKDFFKKILLAEFWKRMLNAKDPTVSSTTFMFVFGGFFILILCAYLVIYSTIKNQGLPGGSTELLIGLATIVMLGKSYTSYTLMKNGNGNKSTDITNEQINNG